MILVLIALLIDWVAVKERGDVKSPEEEVRAATSSGVC